MILKGQQNKIYIYNAPNDRASKYVKERQEVQQTLLQLEILTYLSVRDKTGTKKSMEEF